MLSNLVLIICQNDSLEIRRRAEEKYNDWLAEGVDESAIWIIQDAEDTKGIVDLKSCKLEILTIAAV